MEAREQAAAVFQGRVIATEQQIGTDGYRYQRVTLQVNTAWKGSVARETVVYTGSGGGDCGYSFQQGVEYLVYASSVRAGTSPQVFPTNAFVTNICSRTRPLSEASDDLVALGPGMPVADTPLPHLPNTGAGYSTNRPLSSLPTPLLLAVLTTMLLGTISLRLRKA